MAWTTPRTWVNAEIPTQTEMNTDVRDNMRELWHEVAYVEFTADVAGGNALETAPVDVVSSGAITYAAIPTIIQFECWSVLSVNAQHVTLSLWDGAVDLGRLGRWGQVTTATPTQTGCTISRRLTPTAGSHTYKVRIWGQGVAGAGAGGVGVAMPGYIRVLQKGG